MSNTVHKIYIGVMVLIVTAVTIYLAYSGYTYYQSPLEERFYHPNHDWFKPNGILGHGLGIIGTLMIIFGVGIYMARKRFNFMVRQLRLKYLLEFHIFLCVLGPVLILFHTAFKFGGIVSISFWSMVVVVASGVIGRFIYIQIPRSIEGRELSLNEVQGIRTALTSDLKSLPGMDEEMIRSISDSMQGSSESGPASSFISKRISDLRTIRNIKSKLKEKKIDGRERAKIIAMVKNEISLANKITRLQTMQKLFKYWHVAHLPFALIMLIIMLIHVGVTLAFGYKWIF